MRQLLLGTCTLYHGYYIYFLFLQIIGRVFADPDLLPRSNDFGLNVEAFKETFCQDCPNPVLKLAVICSQVNPEDRLEI